MGDANTVKTDIEDNLFDFMRALDFLIILVCAFIAYHLRHGVFFPANQYYWAITVGIGTFFLVTYLLGFYKFRYLRFIHRHLLGLCISLVMAAFILIAVIFMSKSSIEFSRLWVMYWFALSLFVMFSSHYLIIIWFRIQLKEGKFTRKVVLFGESGKIPSVIERMKRDKREHAEIIAIFTRGKKLADKYKEFKIIDNFKDLYSFCHDNNIDDVIITYDISIEKKAEDDLDKLREIPCNIRYCLPTIFFGKAIQDDNVWNVPMTTIYNRPMWGRKLALKRAEDIILSLIALVLASPLFIILIIAQLIFGGKGPIFFKQERDGFFGQKFYLYKFRSMKEHKETEVVTQAKKNDSRITKLGSFLRKSSLDEIPQVFNVLKGDMSLVGPRPHAVSHNEYYSDIVKSYASRNRMKPGITGWAQVNGWRGETDTIKKMEKRVECDIYYVENWSLWLDIKIMFLTVFVIFHKNAY